MDEKCNQRDEDRQNLNVEHYVKTLISNNYRLVHLDLKGAPPKLSYLKKLLPLIQKHGATGLLIEYEDTFPYSGSLQHLRKHVKTFPSTGNDTEAMESDDSESYLPYYTEGQIKELLQTAAQCNLEVIPLVQTFGHLEFVLKHQRHSCLREYSKQLNALCPRLAHSFDLVQELVKQFLSAHPKAKYIHLGMDEVLIGACERCKVTPREKVFLEWGVKVAGWVRRNFPSVTPIIWDDMLRSISAKDIEASGLCSIVDVMVWKYDAGCFNLPTGYLSTISKLFSKQGVWFASAYKGATGSTQMIVPAQHHINNHITWLNKMRGMNTLYGVDNFKGFVLTGWQRYDHMAVLCELLPASIPCLVLCLEVLTATQFTVDIHSQVSEALGFKQLININPHSCPSADDEGLNFPGCSLYSELIKWHTFCCSVKMHNGSEIFQGWFSPFSRSHRLVSPAIVDMMTVTYNEFHSRGLTMKKSLENELSLIFNKNTVDEWLQCYVTPLLSDITITRTDCLELNRSDPGCCKTSVDSCTCSTR